DFRELFSPEDADLMRPKGGKYPGLSKTVDRSIADATNTASSESTVDGSEDPLDAANTLSFDGAAALAGEKTAPTASETGEPHSVWIKLNDDGKVAHKKSVLRTFMDPTLDI
ncbi:hypothetical protein B0H14DRAFT_2198528, partial [Mycena olivaceomarginata]